MTTDPPKTAMKVDSCFYASFYWQDFQTAETLDGALDLATRLTEPLTFLVLCPHFDVQHHHHYGVSASGRLAWKLC
jgi:hypothetical protein